MADRTMLRVHEDPALFREAVRFTAAETGFSARLIEKDYFCTMVLDYLATAGTELIFKGGTCLAKVYAGFYRLSEDLDFVIPTAVDATRSQRRRRTTASKRVVDDIVDRVRPLRIIAPLTGANDSTQYAAAVAYDSLLGAHEEIIKIEIGLREPLLMAATRADAHTLLLDPIAGAALVPAILVPCLSREETMAEKLRSAATAAVSPRSLPQSSTGHPGDVISRCTKTAPLAGWRMIDEYRTWRLPNGSGMRPGLVDENLGMLRSKAEVA